MKEKDIYKKLANHLNSLGMGYPPSKDLEEILRENFSPVEAEVALAFPVKVIPLQPVGIDEIMESVNLSRAELEKILEGLAQRGLLFSGKTEDGKKGYALQQVGFGFPQSFFWKGENTSHARNMANLVAKYFTTEKTREAYGTTQTKAFRYVPIGKAIEFDLQTVYPYHMIDQVIHKAKIIAVAHCSCRIRANLSGKGCSHLTEVCMKFDDMAEYLIERELAREISEEEALKIITQCEEANLVHFVDNAIGDIKHNCNCCGCSCWSVARIKRRKIPRDIIMATYFIRETDENECTGCGECAEVCPVDSLIVEDDLARIDKEWCIGCGVCIDKCSTGAAKLIIRPDKIDQLPESNFKQLHEKILEEKGLKP